MYRLVIYGWIAVAVLVTGCIGGQNRKMPSLKETYRKNDKIPFGGSVAYNEIKEDFDSVIVVERKQQLPYDGSLDDDETVPVSFGDLFVIITPRIFMTEEEANSLVAFVRRGNDLMIAAADLDSYFLELIGVQIINVPPFLERMPGTMADTKVSLSIQESAETAAFGYFYYPFLNYFKKFPETRTQILGLNERGEPDFISVSIGAGHLYLHASPRVFSDYFLLTGNNIQYAKRTFRRLGSAHTTVHWDEYFKKLRTRQNKAPEKSFSSLDAIMQRPLLKWALLLGGAALFFFVFSNVKRRQQAIPRKVPVANDSVDFAETMGRLYYLNKDNKNIASKMIGYFREHVRTRFFIHLPYPLSVKEDTVRLSQKSGKPVEQITELLNCIQGVEASPEISDEELLMLNLQIEKFYKKK